MLNGGRFADACIESVADDGLRGLPRVGAIDQLVDSKDVLSLGGVSCRFADFYAGYSSSS